MKIGKRLGLGFGLVCLLMVVVGYVGLSSINDIVYQLDITKLVNRALVDTGDAQTNALKLSIYEDEKYYDSVKEEIKNVEDVALKTQGMMKSEKNKELAKEIDVAVDEYYDSTERWWELEQQRNAVGAERAKQADMVMDYIVELIDDILWPFIEKDMANNNGMIPGNAMPKIRNIQQARNAYNRVQLCAQKYQLAKTNEEQDAIALDWIKEIEKTKQEVEKSKASYTTEGGKKAHDNIIDSLNKYAVEVEKFRDINKKQRVEKVVQEEAAAKAMAESREVRDSVYAYIEQVESQANWYSIGIIIFAVVAGIIIALLITNSITTPAETVRGGLTELTNVAQSVADILKNHLAQGDWSKKAEVAIDSRTVERFEICSKRNDQMGDMCKASVAILEAIRNTGEATNACIDQVSTALSQVKSTVVQVASASTQVSSAAQSLSQGSTESAASLEEITSSMTEMGGQTSTNAENASQANSIANHVAQAAATGQERMGQMTHSMQRINSNAEETQKVIKTIDDIAFQTNLLALNAAVEAARAGSHGKGFAVVAEEVRNLAARSAKAAAETAELIENSNKEIIDGVQISEQTADALKVITDNVSQTTDLIGEIAEASKEQANGISQINIGLGQIDSVTQQNTANAEESAAAAEEMSAQAEFLQELVGRFTLNSDQDIAVAARKETPKEAPKDWAKPVDSNKANTVTPAMQIELDDDEFGKF